MYVRPKDHRLLAALVTNAILLAALCVVLAPRAVADNVAAASPGNDLVVMPAQLSGSIFGCYLLDRGRRTLSVYEYSPGDRTLYLKAGRDVQYDAKLADYNTQPPPGDIKQLLDRAAGGVAGASPSSSRSH